MPVFTRDETKTALAVEEQAPGAELGEWEPGEIGEGKGGGKREERRQGGEIDSAAPEEQILAGPCAGPATVRF